MFEILTQRTVVPVATVGRAVELGFNQLAIEVH